MSNSTWKVLELQYDKKQSVLVKYHFDENGYDIEVSDFSRVWAESLSKEQIIERVSEGATSIDPGEGFDQLKIFFGKIAEALDRKEGTAVTVYGPEDGTTLSLHVTAPLPKPLPSFEWTLRLRSLSAQHLEKAILSPLLVHASKLKFQIGSLIAELHDKDRVISKITDRLETSGNDLTSVFPGVSNVKTNRRKPQREQLAKHVKGLSDFDEQAWKNRMSESELFDRLTTEQINNIFIDLVPGQENIHTDTNNKPWWTESSVRKRTSTDLERFPVAKNSVLRSKPSEFRSNTNENSENDDFQRQSTPPRFKNNESKALKNPSPNQENAPSHRGDESTTDEEDDLDAGPSTDTRLQMQSAGTTRVQAVRESPHPSKLQESGAAKPSTKPGVISGEKEEKSSEGRSQIQRSGRQPKLGMIGGKASNAAESSISPPSPQSLVVKGKEQDRDKSSTQFPDHEPPRSHESTVIADHRVDEPETKHSGPVKTPDPEPTSQERADQKRDLLKRELEQKANIPIKKKRKF